MANPQKENGHLDLANEIVEALAKTQLCGYESRILWAVWRKTYAWHKKEDWISYSQFRELTNLIDPNINRTLKRLIKRKILIKNDKSYRFNKNYDEWQKLSKLITGLIKIDKKKLSKLIDTKEKPKETITKEIVSKDTKPPADKRNLEVQVVIDYADKMQFGLQGSQQQNRRYAFNLIRKKYHNQPLGVERVKFLIRAAVKVRGQPYMPNINDFRQLFYNWQNLLIKLQEKKNDKKFINLDN